MWCQADMVYIHGGSILGNMSVMWISYRRTGHTGPVFMVLTFPSTAVLPYRNAPDSDVEVLR